MARPLSEEKREAILAAAAELVAQHGTGTATAKIARAAGIAEGTLFTYFPTKDNLLDQLFLGLETELAAALQAATGRKAAPREHVRQLWNALIDWSIAHPAKHRALRQLKVVDRIAGGNRRATDALFVDVRGMLDHALTGHVAKDLAPAWLHRLLNAMAEMTLECIAREPKKREQYKKTGFEVFWKGIAR